MEYELKYKIPKEVFDWFHDNGTNVDGKWMFYPFWMEIIDVENSIVKIHRLGDLPDELERLIKDVEL